MSTDRDERIVATRQRWRTHGFALLLIALNIDVLVRMLILKQEPRQWLDIAAIWMGTAVFVCIGTTASGVQLDGGKWSNHWPIILTIVAIPVVLMLMGGLHGLADLIGVLAAAAAGVFTMLIIMHGIYRVWERKTLGRGSREE